MDNLTATDIAQYKQHCQQLLFEIKPITAQEACLLLINPVISQN